MAAAARHNLSFPLAVSSVCVLAAGLPQPLQLPQVPRATQSLGGALMTVLEKCSLQAGAQLGQHRKCLRGKKKVPPSPASRAPSAVERPMIISPQPQPLTQKLGTGLVGAKCLCLLPVLADQAEPGRAGHGMVELGRDVVLDLSPAQGRKSSPEWPPPYVLRTGPGPSSPRTGVMPNACDLCASLEN